MRALGCLLIVAACGGEARFDSSSAAPGPDAASFGSGSGSGSGSGDCPTCACPIEQRCDPGLGGEDCTTGCCAVALDDLGQPRHDEHGAAVHVCVTPACLTDADCGTPGDSCLIGASCVDNRCGCATDPDPNDDDDRDLVCCAASNVNGVCCTTGEVDAAGTCVCPDPKMIDHGWGCECPDGLVPGDDGACRCQDPTASYDAATASCVCPAGTIADQDPYTGQLLCETDPPGCGDPDAHVDPSTGECECNPGYVEGDTAGGVTAACVPIGCGDGVCSPGESCATCDFDCPCDPGPDAGVPDAAPGDGGGSGGLDAGVILDASGPPDARVIPDAGAPPDAVITGRDAGVFRDAGSGSGSGSGSGHR